MSWCNKISRIGFVLGLLAAPLSIHAQLVSTIISGRGNATVALPSDTFVAVYNPAGLAWIQNRWDLGVNWERDWGRTQISGNSNPNNNSTFNPHHTENFFIPEFGVNKTMCDKGTMSIGVMTYNRGYSKTTYRTSIPIFGTSDLGVECLQQVASIIGSLRFGCDHAAGITIDFVGQRLKVKGLENLEQFSSRPSKVTNNKYQYSGGIGVTLGWMSKVSDCVSFGLAYSPEIIMSHIRGYKGLLAQHGRLNIPQRFLGGFAVQFLPDAYFDFDVEYVCWNGIPSLRHPILRHNNPEDPDALPHLGKDRGSGLGWGGQAFFRFGVDWEIEDYLVLRAGYSYARANCKKRQALFNALAPNITEHYASFGGTWRISFIDEISFYVAYGVNNNVVGTDAIPTSLGGGSVKLKESRTWAGLSWARCF